MLEETARTARRVLGGAHPVTAAIEGDLQNARAAFDARKTPEKQRDHPQQPEEEVAKAKKNLGRQFTEEK